MTHYEKCASCGKYVNDNAKTRIMTVTMILNAIDPFVNAH